MAVLTEPTIIRDDDSSDSVILAAYFGAVQASSAFVCRRYDDDADFWVAKHNWFGVGDDTNVGDKYIVARTGAANPPFIRYNVSASAWELSDNGTDYNRLGPTATPTFASLTLESNAQTNVTLLAYSNASQPVIFSKRARGTKSSPSAVQANDELLAIVGQGYHSGGSFSNTVASMRFVAAENFTPTAQGAYIYFETTPTGSTTRVERMRIDSSGTVYVWSPLSVIVDGAGAYYTMRTHDNTQWSVLYFERSRGTKSAPSAVQSGDVLGGMQFRGYDGSSYGLGAFIYAYAAETFTTTAHGGYIRFFTVPTGSTSYSERMRINHDGVVYIYSTADPCLSLSGGLKIGSLTGVLLASSGTVSALAATAGLQYLRRNSGNTAYEWATISASDVGAAPVSAAFVTIGNDATLTNERALAVGASLTLTDGGANGSVTLNAIQDIRTTATPTFASLTLDSNAQTNATLFAYSDASQPVIFSKRARGTKSSPSAVQAGDELLAIVGQGYHSGGAFSNTVAAIRFVAAENFTSTAQGTYIYFETTPTGSTTHYERMRIESSGTIYAWYPLWLVGDGSYVYCAIRTHASGQFSVLYFDRSRGTKSAPTAVQSGDVLGGMQFRGYDGSSYGLGAFIYAYAAETFTTTAHGSYISFYTVPTGSTSYSERMRINHDGVVYIYSTASPCLSLSGGLKIGSLTGALFASSGTVSALAATAGSQYLRRNAGNTAYEWATISASDVGAAPVSAAFVTIGNDATLTNERALAVGTSLTLTDGGANGSVTLNTIQDIRTTDTPTFASLTLDSNAQTNVTLFAYSSSSQPVIFSKRARGTKSSPSAVQSGDELLAIVGQGYHSGGAFSNTVASIRFVAAESFTSTAQGSYIYFETTPTGSTTRVERLRIESSGTIYAWYPLGIIVDSASGHCVIRSHSNTYFSVLYFDKTRGTKSAPSAVQSGDVLGGMQFRGYDGSSYGLGAFIYAYADETFTTTAHGGHISFFTTPTGSTSYSERMRITAGGVVEAYNSLACYGDGKDSNLYAFRYSSDSTGPKLGLGKARGSRSSPSAVQYGDFLGEIEFSGSYGSGINYTAAIIARATEAFSSTTGATEIAFYTTASGNTGYIRRMYISSLGALVIDSSIHTDTVLQVGGKSVFYQPCKFTTTTSEGGIVFARGVSSHPSTKDLSLWYYGKHFYFGKSSAALQVPGLMVLKTNSTSTTTTASYFINTTLYAYTIEYPGALTVRARGRITASASVTPSITFEMVLGSTTISFVGATAALAANQWVWWELTWYLMKDDGTNTWKAHALWVVSGIIGGTTGYAQIDASNSRVAYHTYSSIAPSSDQVFKVGMKTSSTSATIYNDYAEVVVV